MPSVSKSQRRLMAMALAYKQNKLKGKASNAVKKLAQNMSIKDLEDFASTPESNLPEKIGEQIEDEIGEQSWEGTTKAMKKQGEIDNPFALVNFMKKKGYKPHYTKSGKKLKESFSLIKLYENLKNIKK